MSTNPVLVPISLVSQFLANEKMASRHWLQCQMECLLDQVFDQLSTKFEDYLASNAITGTAQNTTIDSDCDAIQHDHQHENSFNLSSHPQFQSTADHMINTLNPVAVVQSSNGQMMNVNVQANQNGTHSESLIFDQAQFPHSPSVPTSNLEQMNQNDLDEDDDQQLILNDDIDNHAAQVDSDQIEIKEEVDDSNDEQLTRDHPQNLHLLSVPTSNLEQSNQNNDEVDYGLNEANDQPPNEDIDASGVDNDEIEVKDEIDDTDNEIAASDQNSQTSQPVFESTSNELEYGEIDDDAQMDIDEVKEEIDDTNNQLSTADQPQNQALLPVPTSNVDQSNENDYEYDGLDGDDAQVNLHNEINNELMTNEQNLQILPEAVASDSNEQSNHNLTNGDDEDDCDCDDCRNGIELEEEDDDDDDVQIIEDEDELPRKKSRLESTIQPNDPQQSHVNRQSPILEQSNIIERQPTEVANETNKVPNQDNQIIALRLQCLETGCSLMFKNKTELNAHMSTQHNILPHQCLVKNCRQSFDKPKDLKRHIAQDHPNTSKWYCGKCEKHCSTYDSLSTHNHQYHLLGHYQCTFPNCAFVGGHKEKVYSHYRNLHKATTDRGKLTCEHPGCGRRFMRSYYLEKHLKAHLAIRKYTNQSNNLQCITRLDMNLKETNESQHLSRQSNLIGSNPTETHREEVNNQEEDCNYNERTEHNDGPILPRKDHKMDNTTQLNNRQQSSSSVNRNQTDQDQQNNDQQSNFDQRQPNEQTEQSEQSEVEDETIEVKKHDKQITTLLVQCLHTGCSRMFTNQTKLNAHMNTQHKILLHRCLVKDCRQSFSTQNHLTGHIAQVHPHTTQWHCDKCPKHFAKYSLLYFHNYQMHQLGQYACAFSNCAFIGKTRRKVICHYKHQHKEIAEFICQNIYCGLRFTDRSKFEQHQQVHRDIKIYRRQWPKPKSTS